MIIFKDYKTFSVLGSEINIIHDYKANCAISVAEINDKIYYLGSEGSGISAAVFAWQNINGRDLTSEEFRQVLVDNNLISDAI